MSEALGAVLDSGMAIGPILGYLYQYRLIKLSECVGSFSIDICGILLFANILRLNFYLFKKYETALVFQSIFMIIMQMFLLRLCVKSEGNKIKADMANIEEGELSLEPSYHEVKEDETFWRWKKFSSYFLCVAVLTGVTFSVSTFMLHVLHVKSFGELSILIVPQIVKNIKMSTTKGLSYMLVFLNLAGDVFKLLYFVAKFILCGIIQVTLDSFVVGQIIHYRKKQKQKRLKKSGQTLTPLKKKKEETDNQLVSSELSSTSLSLPGRQLSLKIAQQSNHELIVKQYPVKVLSKNSKNIFEEEIIKNGDDEIQDDQQYRDPNEEEEDGDGGSEREENEENGSSNKQNMQQLSKHVLNSIDTNFSQTIFDQAKKEGANSAEEPKAQNEKPLPLHNENKANSSQDLE